MATSKLVVVALALGAAACSSGGGSKATTSSGGTISGTARAAPATDVDSDTGDPYAPTAPNGSFATAQRLQSVVTLGGWSYATTSGGGSVGDVDIYRASLAAGQVIKLDIAAPTQLDLDLYLFYVASTATGSAPSLANAVAASQGVGATETLQVPATEDYYVAVMPFDPGHLVSTNYVLTLGRAGTASAGTLSSALDAATEFVPGEVIVRFRDDLPFAAGVETLAARAASLGLAAKRGGVRREMLMEFPPGAAGRAAALAANGITTRVLGPLGLPVVDDLEAERLDTVRLVKALRRRADVATADLNYIRHALAVPNDQYYGFQWHYPQMKLPQAWDVTTGTRTGGGQVTVAVIDTGILRGHPDLANKIDGGYDFIQDPTSARDFDGIDNDPTDEGTSPNPGQSSWHGSHVAGTIAAETNNTIGVAGVSWDARIMPLRVLGLNGSGTSYDILQAVKYAAKLSNDSFTVPTNRADVINLSLGGTGSSAAEQAVYTEVVNAGVIVVAAAGNNGKDELFYPASYPGVVSVSAVDMLGQRAPYSNFSSQVDVAAPGGDMSQDRDANGVPDGVLSCVGDDSSGALQASYWVMNGTSMASPHMAGVVALMKAVCPTLTPANLDAALSSGAITSDLGATGRDDIYGHGLIDALAAVQWANDPVHCTSSTPPPAVTTISATPARADFAPGGATSKTITLARSGPDAVTGVTVTGKPSWLTITPPGGTGLGTYTLVVNASGLGDGVYSASLRFLAQPINREVIVPVTLQVGAAAATGGDAGFVYLLLLDSTTRATVKQAARAPVNGDYAFTFTGVPAGKYYLVAGTDSNNDGMICDTGESCGAYPTLSQPVEIDPASPPANLRFQVGFNSGLGGAAAGGEGAVIPPGGVKLLPALKTSAVRP